MTFMLHGRGKMALRKLKTKANINREKIFQNSKPLLRKNAEYPKKEEKNVIFLY